MRDSRLSWARRLMGAGDAPTLAERGRLLARLHADRRLDPKVVDAIGQVSRPLFVPPEDVELAWEDAALEIGPSATISAPSMVAEMLTCLELQPELRVLEIGSGSGYAAACMAALGVHVVGLELLPDLADQGRRHLARTGFSDLVEIHTADGSRGWPEAAPYDRILASASVDAVPPAWMAQVADGGLIVYPESTEREDLLVRLTRLGEGWHREELGRCRFVRMRLGA